MPTSSLTERIANLLGMPEDISVPFYVVAGSLRQADWYVNDARVPRFAWKYLSEPYRLRATTQVSRRTGST
jgi:hypothetical protein